MGKKLTTEEFIYKAKLIHGDKYDYSLVNYKINNVKVRIICRIHGEFEQPPISHLSGRGYSATDLKNHISSLFTDGMTWGNYGEWHIDHIKRVSEFDKDSNPTIVNALYNLRPLWATTREINGVIYEGNLNRG